MHWVSIHRSNLNDNKTLWNDHNLQLATAFLCKDSRQTTLNILGGISQISSPKNSFLLEFFGPEVINVGHSFTFTLFKTSKQQPCRDLPLAGGKCTAGSETSVQFTATSCQSEWASGSLETQFFYNHIAVTNWKTNQARLSTSFDLIHGTWVHMTYAELYMLWLKTKFDLISIRPACVNGFFFKKKSYGFNIKQTNNCC